MDDKMLVSFSVGNWMSFRSQVTFSMVATKERQHGYRVPKIKKYNTRLLPIAVIYGGNASGKTNFFKALNFAKRLVVEGTQPDNLIPVEPFRLASQSFSEPSCFVFEILINETIYEYSFSVTRKSIHEEKLVEITNSNEKVLYHRQKEEPYFSGSLKKDERLNFAYEGTRDNQLFLTNSVSQKVDYFRPVYDWFKDSLDLVAPDSRFRPFELFFDQEHPLYSKMNEMLGMLDTGIMSLGGENIPFENIPISDVEKTEIQEFIKDGMTFRLIAEPINERYVVTRINGNLIAKKLVAYHLDKDGNPIRFDIRHESDGSQRIIDLLPAFLDVSANKSNKVYVIDELDRSLHTLVSRRLLEGFLQSCSADSRSQVLLTTHDVLLMDQQLLRRDEMWVTERNHDGSSNLVSFSEFKDIRYDKDIRKSYLQGRLGGIPRILITGALNT